MAAKNEQDRNRHHRKRFHMRASIRPRLQRNHEIQRKSESKARRRAQGNALAMASRGVIDSIPPAIALTVLEQHNSLASSRAYQNGSIIYVSEPSEFLVAANPDLLGGQNRKVCGGGSVAKGVSECLGH